MKRGKIQVPEAIMESLRNPPRTPLRDLGIDLSTVTSEDRLKVLQDPALAKRLKSTAEAIRLASVLTAEVLTRTVK